MAICKLSQKYYYYYGEDGGLYKHFLYVRWGNIFQQSDHNVSMTLLSVPVATVVTSVKVSANMHLCLTFDDGANWRD